MLASEPSLCGGCPREKLTPLETAKSRAAIISQTGCLQIIRVRFGADTFAKLPKFRQNRPNEPQSRTDVASRPLPKSPVRSSQDNVVPQTMSRSPRIRPGKFVSVDAKRVLQQYRVISGFKSDIAPCPKSAANRRYRRLQQPTEAPYLCCCACCSSSLARRQAAIRSLWDNGGVRPLRFVAQSKSH